MMKNDIAVVINIEKLNKYRMLYGGKVAFHRCAVFKY